MRRVFATAIAVGMGLLLTSCRDDGPTGAGGRQATVKPSISGTVWSMADSTPISGATIALVSGVPYNVAAGPVTSDGAGHFTLANVPTGTWYLFVFTRSYLMHNSRDAIVTVDAGSRITRSIGMIPSALWGTDGPRAEGIVTDAVSGGPVAGAYVSSTGWQIYNPFIGIPLSSECITGADGRYSVELLNLYQLSGSQWHLGVSKEGYDPFFWTLEGSLDDDTTLTVDAGLIRPAGTGRIRGRVMKDGVPVEGVPVGLDYIGFPNPAPSARQQDVERVPMLGRSTVSASDGSFEFSALVAGHYSVEAAYLPDDGYVALETGWKGRDLADGAVVDIGRMDVARAIHPVSPPPGGVSTTSRPVLRWEAVPGADYYRLSYGTGHLLNSVGTNATSWQPAGPFPEGEHVRWIVTAFRESDPGDEELSAFESPVAFEVGP